MLSDEERISLIVGDDAGVEARADAALLAALLADPTTWEEPPGQLEAAVVAQIHEEAATERGAPPAPASRAVSRLPVQATRRPRRWVAPLIGVAAAGAAALGAGLILRSGGDDAVASATLAPSDLVPDATGKVEIFAADSGFRIVLDATGLDPLPNGRFYEAWVRSEEGTLVSIGTFSESAGLVTLWAGVDPRDFGAITITIEAPDGDPTSAGMQVLLGPVTDD